MLLDGEIDIAPIPSIEYARNADRLRILPRLCVSSEGAIDSIQLVTRMPFGQVRSVAVTPESATSVVLDPHPAPEGRDPPARDGRGRDAADRRRGAAQRVRGPDAALRPRPALARATGLPMVFAVWAAPEPSPRASSSSSTHSSPRCASLAPSRSSSRARRARRTAIPQGFLARYFEKLRYSFGPRERAGLYTFLEMARDAGELDHVPELRFVREEVPGMTITAEPTPAVDEVLDKALGGERITDDDAIALLRSRDLVEVGRVANEMRNRLDDPSRVTFIVDRNLNYTNVCVTDCDFCAFYRRPGDVREGYLLPKPVIYKKIEETLAIGGTGLLMQGGHHPDLGIDYYEDLFSSIKARYKIHLHALSPPEIQHIARRSKLTIPETLSRLRDAGLDSVPGGGAEILVDRVRAIIAPKKTKTEEWLDVMRQAHRLGMSTTATMMYGHVETLEERVEHMRKIRELQDETARLPRLHLLDVPARRQPHRRHGLGRRDADLLRLPAHAGGLADLPRQRSAHPVVAGSRRG